MSMPASMSDSGTPDDGVSASMDEPMCSVDGCDQHVVPGSDTCGVHSDPDNVDDAQDGTGSVADVTGIGGQDGTGRSAKRWRPRHKASRGRLRDALHKGELRADPGKDGTAILSGTAIVYNVRTIIHDVFGEFGESIQCHAAAHLLDGDVRLLANHDGLPLARTTAETLVLRDAEWGVDFAAELDVAGSPLAADIVSGVRSGNLSGCSFAFTVGDKGDVWNSSMTERSIKKFASLPEISIVTFPAYPTTSVSARAQQLSATQTRLRARREQIRRHQEAAELRDMLNRGVPLKKKPVIKTPPSPEVDEASKQRSITEAGVARRAAMKSHGVRSYRSLRASVNDGRDTLEVRES